MLTYINSSVWQQRTNKIIAATVIFIGLTMLISTIPQCIYAGLAFIVAALGWLGWMRMKENKEEPPRPSPPDTGQTASPVLFLVSSQTLPLQGCREPTLADPNDKPPTYDQIVKLDGLPPDYVTVLAEKPPRYEDIEAICPGLKLCRTSSGIPIEIYHPSVAQVDSYGQPADNQIFSTANLSASCPEIDVASYYAISDMTGLPYYGSVSHENLVGSLGDAEAEEVSRQTDHSKVCKVESKINMNSEESPPQIV